MEWETYKNVLKFIKEPNKNLYAKEKPKICQKSKSYQYNKILLSYFVLNKTIS